MVANLHDLTLVHHHYLVRMADGAEPVGNHHHRTVLEDRLQRVHDFLLVDGVQRVGRLVQEQELRIPVQRPGYQQPLLLPAAQPPAVFPYLGIKPLGHRMDLILYLRRPAAKAEPFIVCLLVVQHDVVQDGVAQQPAVLHDHPAKLPPFPQVDGRHVHVPHLYRAVARLVQADQQFQQRGFSAAAAADNRRDLVFRDGQVDMFQHQGRIRGILEHHVLQPDFLVLRQYGRRADGQQFLLVIQITDLVHAHERDSGILGGHDKTDELRQRAVQHADDELRGNHHAHRDLTADDGSGAEEHDGHVLHTLHELGTEVLRVRHGQHPLVHPVRPGSPPISISESSHNCKV